MENGVKNLICKNRKKIVSCLSIFFGSLIFATNLFSNDCEGDFATNDWTNYCYGTHQGRTETYEGQWLDNRYHGQGKLTYNNGVYEGEFSKDLFNGHGIWRYEDESYIGLHKDGKWHGQGIYESDLVTFEGEFEDGYYKKGKEINKKSGVIEEGEFNQYEELHGYGKRSTPSVTHEGFFKNGALHGKITSKWPDGSYFEGEYSEGIREGFGKLAWPDGEYYEGEWKMGDYEGKGVYQYGSGLRYEGEFVDGEWEGEGIIYYSNGTTYEGELKNGFKHGYGREDFLTGAIYEGNHMYDEANGEGKYYYGEEGECLQEVTFVNSLAEGYGKEGCKDGYSYEGEYLNGLYHGQGKYVFEDGRIFEGKFKNSFFEFGKLIFTNGDYYVGEFYEDLMSGYGTYTFANGDIYEGNFYLDYFDGSGTYTYANGEQIIGTWVHDKFISSEFSMEADFSELNDEELIKSIQELLTKIGYDPGEINGVLGIKTSSAISAFQQSRNKAITGEADLDLLVQLQIELRKITTVSFAQPQSSSKEEIYPVLASGTGFFIDETILVTNYHVIEGCNYLTVNYQEKLSILKVDEVNDLAILKSPNPNPSFLTLSEDPDIGEEVYVGGFPHSYELGNFNFTIGNISSLSGFNRNFSEFQFTAPIQPGNSGGPIVNSKGGLVGITVSSLDDVYFLTESGSVPQNVNFGIKVSILKEVLREIDFSFKEGNKFWFWGSTEDLADLSNASSTLINCHQKQKI